MSTEEFTLKPKEKTDILIKDTVIDLYINSLRCLQRLIFYKEPIFKENRVTIENIVNLRQIKRKKKKTVNKIENKIIFRERIEKIGLNFDNLLEFESHFESGNLQLAYISESLDEINDIDNNKNMNTNNINSCGNLNTISTINNDINTNNYNNNLNGEIKNEKKERYELFLHNDTNTSGYTQWFFFRVSNTKKNKKVNLNIMNFLRKRTKYSNGIKIWCYSRKNSEINKIGWHHTTEEVNYYQNFLYKLNKGKKDYYYTLSFNYTFEFDNDEVFFANCIPFTYTDLTRDLNFYTKNENDKYIFFDRRKLCSTIIGNTVEYFTINHTTSIYPYIISNTNANSNKNGVVLFGRQHPSETVGSWTLKGAIDFLMGESDEAKYLRDKFIFKIIPMINVDGVICGNTRTSLSGCDLNRRWSNPNILLHPEIFYSKELIIDFCKKYKIECIVDFHGHFGAFNSFFYGNHKEDNYSSCRFFPFTCAKKSKVIQFEKSKFKMPKYKRGTGRINLFKELNVENVVTLETSYFGCNSGGYVNQYFTVETLKEIGRDICNGILLFHYHSNLQMGINNDLNNYPFLEKKLENEEKIINNQFTEYLNKIKNEENEEKDLDEKNTNETIKEEEKNNNNDDKDDDDDDDNLNDNISESESDPSGDNFDENEIIKLLPPKKLKKIFKKNFKKKRNNKRQMISINHNINKNNNINIAKYNHNSNGLPEKNNNMPMLPLPKVKENKNRINNINSNNGNSKSRKNIINTFDDENYHSNKNNNNNNIGKNILSKNTLFRLNPTTPNLINNNNIKQVISLNINISTNKNKNVITCDKSTQTEEIFFSSNWRNFLGKYRILTPKIDKYEIMCQLKPIKFTSIKNSYSYTNKKEILFNNSVLPIPQTIDVSSRKNRENKILDIIKKNRYNYEDISPKRDNGNRNNSVIPFVPMHNNLMKKQGRSFDKNVNNKYNNFNLKNAVNFKKQNLINCPVVKTKNIFLKKNE